LAIMVAVPALTPPTSRLAPISHRARPSTGPAPASTSLTIAANPTRQMHPTRNGAQTAAIVFTVSSGLNAT
jgi:hypothetical protein